MSRSRWLFALALSAGALVSPSPAHANDPESREPLFSIGGAQTSCVNNSGAGPGVAEILITPPNEHPSYEPPHPLAGPRPEAWADVAGIDADMVKSWQSGGNNGYDQCNPNVSFDSLANRLKNTLTAWKATLNSTRPPAEQIDKIDIVATSLGSTISRYCIQRVAGCAALVDDWVGIVPPSHGTYYGALFYLDCNSVLYKAACQASKPGGSVISLTNGTNVGGSGDETRYGSTDPGGWIEYTTIRAVNDGLIMGPGPAYASGTERLTGAANWRSVTPDTPTTDYPDTTHENYVGSQPYCAGSARYGQNGLTEAIAAEVADVTDRSTWDLSTATSFDVDLHCTSDLIDG